MVPKIATDQHKYTAGYNAIHNCLATGNNKRWNVNLMILFAGMGIISFISQPTS